MLHARPPCFDLHFKAGVLRVGGHRHHQGLIGDHPGWIVFSPVLQLLGSGIRLGVLVAEAKAGVVEHLHAFVIATRQAVFCTGVLPGQRKPGNGANRHVEGRQGEADRLAIACGCCYPACLATSVDVGKHGRFVVLIDLEEARGAHKPGTVHVAGFWITREVEVVQHQCVQVSAVRTRNVVFLLGPHVEKVINLAEAFGAWAAGVEELAVVGVLRGSGLSQLHRVALIVNVQLQAVDLVHIDEGRGDFGQVGRRASGIDVQRGIAQEILGLHGVAAVAAFGGSHALAQLRYVADHGAHPRRETLHQGVGGLQRQDVARLAVDERADPVQRSLRLEHLGGHLGYHPFAWMAWRQHLVHAPGWVAAVKAERPRLGAALGEDHELLGPYVHEQLGVGARGLHGGADYEFVAVSQIHAAFLIGTLLFQFASITARPRGGGTALPHIRTCVDLLKMRPSWPRSMM